MKDLKLLKDLRFLIDELSEKSGWDICDIDDNFNNTYSRMEEKINELLVVKINETCIKR